MAFYGNITNTSKTTFQFDQTYSNKYEMDHRAGVDGVFVGRYVLVDYDKNLDETSYILDAGNEHVYLYDNAEQSGYFNLYTERPEFIKDSLNNILYVAANPYTYYQFQKGVDDGRCLALLPGHVIKDVNRTARYFRITGKSSTETPGHYILNVSDKNDKNEVLTVNEFVEYWEAYQLKHGKVKYVTVALDETTYEPYTFWVRQINYDALGNEIEKYVVCSDTDFDENQTYYDLTGPDIDKLGVVNGYGVFFGSETWETNAIYRVNPGYLYNLNTDLQYWAISDWTVAKRYVKNPNYDKALENPDDPNTLEYILEEVDCPTWSQLAARVVENNGSNDVIWDFIPGPVKPNQNYKYEDDYTINLTIDRTYYGTSRGYDSTVWQKVYDNGKDKYVMVAELNSVVPTFDVEADAPTPVPLTPHFDPDSSNVYYRLHVQPSWGLRTKFASPNISVPKINANGQITGDSGSSRITPTIYPSDQTTTWESDFYDKYNDEKSHKTFVVNSNNGQGQWVDASEKTPDGETIPAAIYFNKAGFNPGLVTYSADILDREKPSYNSDIKASGWTNTDKFEMTPTGHSGMLYDNHGFGTQTTLSVDTQEFSVMLPSLGDALAQIWDIIFGGRDTNSAIATSHKRNTDYLWEDARKGLNRHGLRMVGTEIFNGYNKAEVNTLAGCINSTHDLMGMIISSLRPEDLYNNLEELDDDYIYYVDESSYEELPENAELAKIWNQRGKYLYKHKGYKYIEAKDVFQYKPVTPSDDNFDISLYYVESPKNSGNYVQAKDGDEGPFYAKTVTSSEKFEAVTGLTPFDGSLYYYCDGLSIDMPKASEEEKLKMSNWVREPEYQSGRQYYTIDPATHLTPVDVSQEFQPGLYYYKDEAHDYILSFEEKADPSKIYYVIDDGPLGPMKDIRTFGYDNVYSPGVYFYKDKNGNFKIDTDDDGVWDANEDNITELVTHWEANAKDNPDASTIVQKIEYQKAELTQSDIENFDPTSYHIQSAPGEYVPNTQPYQAGVDYFYKIVSLVTQPTTEIYTVGKEVTLTPYVKYTFYTKVKEGGKIVKYEHLTAQRIRNMVKDGSDEGIYVFGVIDNWQTTASGNIFNTEAIDKSDPDKWACRPQNVFYVPGLYHFLDGSDPKYQDYVLDIYSSMHHKGYYYVFKKAPTKVNLKFYEPYKYYTQNKNGEYVLIKDNLTSTELEQLKNNIFDKKTYYVLSDSSGTFQPGMEWNPNVTNIPPTVTLATRVAKTELRPLDEFARNLNTMHGLILKINRMLLMNDQFTRDERTVQGAVNALNDKVAQFGKMTPNEVMVVDNYGRTQSAEYTTLQKGTSELIKNTNVADSLNNGIKADTYSTAADVASMREQWVTLNIDGNVKNPKLTIHHNFQAVDNKPFTTDLNNGTDTVVLYNPIVDKMGHIVGTKMNTVTLPYGFKTIKVTNTADSKVEAPATTIKEAGQIADNTQDTLTFAATNRWIKLDNNTEDTIKVGHLLSPFVTGTAPNTLYGLTSNLTVAQLDTDNTFEVPCLQFDEAGHILEARTHTVTLPENFTTHAITVSDTNNADSTVGTAGNITPDTLTDTLTFAEGNRWINLAADATNDKITISHYVKNFTETTSALDFNTESNGKTFTVQTIGWDRAGHLISSDKKTFTLPDNFKTLAIGNTGKTTVSFDTATDGNLVADTLVDTATFDIGNRWLSYVANTNGDKVTLYHAAPDANSASTNTTQTGNETPNFGATFYIPEVKYDEAGHIFKVDTHTVKIPLPSLVQDDSGNVITGLALSDTEGKFTITKEDLGTLTLGTYSKDNDNGDIVATDTLAQALSKLQTQIHDEENARAQAIKDLIGEGELNAAFDTIKEISDWLAGNDTDADKIIDAIATLTGEEDIDGSVKQQIKAAMDGLGTAASKNVEDFASADIFETTTFEYTISAEEPVVSEGEEESTAKTIAWLFSKVAELEARLAELEPPVNNGDTTV